MPDVDVTWAPPILSAGDVAALAEVLERHRELDLRVGPAVQVDAGRRLVAALSPQTRVRGATAGVALTQLLAQPLPLQRQGDPEGAGLPRYAADGIGLDAARWQEGDASGAARAVLAVDRAPVDREAWGRQPAAAVGSCSRALEVLGTGQEQSLAVLEPFLDHADGLLLHFYRQGLLQELPTLRRALSARRGAAAAEEGAARGACEEAAKSYLDAVAPCLDEGAACPVAPRVFLVGTARIGAAAPEAYLPEECAETLGHDYEASLARVAREAARTVIELLDARWSALSDRVAALAEVQAALDDLCAPRRWRFAEADLAQARGRLAEIGELFRSPDPDRAGGGWLLDEVGFHVAGLGVVRQLARFEAGEESASRRVVRDARALREFVLGHSQCRAPAGNLPLAAVLVDLDGNRVDFLGYFYDEELFCDELPPLRAG
jgi:hypothetical protein